MPFRSFSEKEAAILAVKEAAAVDELGSHSLYEPICVHLPDKPHLVDFRMSPVCALAHIDDALGERRDSCPTPQLVQDRTGLTRLEQSRITTTNDGSLTMPARAVRVCAVLQDIPVGIGEEDA